MLFDDLRDCDEPKKEAMEREMPAQRELPMRAEKREEAPYESQLDTLRFDIQEDVSKGTRIKVIGVGGGGSNAVGRMFLEGVRGVEFYAVDSDQQALRVSPVPNKLLIGHKVTAGLGAGADPNMGKEAALEDTERIIEMLDAADMVFVAAGLGGGTGTGAAPIIASLAKELNALTVAIVTKPFSFEGTRRMRGAERGLDDLSGTVDTLIQIPNQKLTSLAPKGTPLMESFRVADDVLRQAVVGISDIMNTPGLINRDFSDIKSIMSGMGHAMMGTATARGENAAVEAARQAIASPMLEEEGVKGARAVLINITASSQISLHDVEEACTLVQRSAQNNDVMVNFGIVLEEGMGDRVKVTVIATGFSHGTSELERTATFAALPAVDEPGSVFSGPAFTMPMFPEPLPPVEPVEEEEEEETLSSELEPLLETEPETVLVNTAAAATNGHVHDEPVKVTDDLEVPAFLRRERRGFFSS